MDNSMKIRMKTKMTFEQANLLIERYYDGLTSVKEEKQLQEFLSQPNLPSQYEPEQAIFAYFKPQLTKTNFSKRSYIRWASIAAIFVVVVFSLQLLFVNTHTSYAFIDGKKTTNMNVIKSNAIAMLNDLPSGNEEIEKGFNSLNDKDIIRQQLDMLFTLE